MVFQPKRRGIPAPSSPAFYIGGNAIEIVDKWPHLGHIITCECNDDADISNWRNSLVSQISNVLCYFKHLSSTVKLKLLQAYCSVELMRWQNRGYLYNVEEGLRRAWSLLLTNAMYYRSIV